MAKKVVATLQKTAHRNLAKVICASKSPKTGAYTFKEKMVPLAAVPETLAKNS